jgi:hypothetical protein
MGGVGGTRSGMIPVYLLAARAAAPEVFRFAVRNSISGWYSNGGRKQVTAFRDRHRRQMCGYDQGCQLIHFTSS